MGEKLSNWIGARAHFCVTLLALIVAGNVLFQVYTHKTTPLLAWKGGGFGMYTEPHAEDRSVWLELRSTNGTASVQLWPESAEFKNLQRKASLRGGTYLSSITYSAERFRYYPRIGSADALIGKVSRVRWPETFVAGIAPTDGKIFSEEDISLYVYESRFDVASNQVKRVVVFTQAGPGAR